MRRGRDEMNLAEFPLTGLTSRREKGKDTLVFEDSTPDKQAGRTVKRRLTVSASTEYGLPRALDDEVILGLVQLSKAGSFSGRKISFVPAELFRLLGWREEGRSYARLETSLKRWLGVTLYYDNAWRDNARKIWIDEHFHLLENVVVRRRRKGTGTEEVGEKRKLWSVTWNEVVFQSFEAGYLKKLDMELYRTLRLAASKRMYRFLDKRLHYRRRKAFDLRTFACEHIGFGRRDDNAQLKRRLNPATDELEKVGFLEPISEEDRYQKICRGKWEVVFERKRREKSNRSVGSLEAALTQRGVWESVALRLVRDHPASMIRAAIGEFDGLTKSGKALGLGNPPGLLVAWIRERGEMEVRKSEIQTLPAKNEQPRTRRRQETDRESAAEASALSVKKYLEGVSPKDLELLRTEAFDQAEPLLVKGYRRNLARGSEQLSREYCCMIIEAHVRRILGLRSS